MNSRQGRTGRGLRAAIAAAAVMAAMLLLGMTSWAAPMDKTQVELTGQWVEKDGGYTFVNAAGQTVRGGLRIIDGKIYWFKADGTMAHDETINLYNTNYTFGSDGAAEAEITPSVTILPEEQKTDAMKKVDRYCDELLAKITTPEMKDYEKACAIYQWLRQNIAYKKVAEDPNWYAEVMKGFRTRTGDCWTYAMISQALLTRCGMECKLIVRNRDNNHYWHLVKLSDGYWYHFDTTPRSFSCDLCLITDQQILEISGSKNFPPFEFALNKYPRTPLTQKWKEAAAAEAARKQ